MNRLWRIPFTDRALVMVDDRDGEARHYPGGMPFRTNTSVALVRDGETVLSRNLGSGVITTAGVNQFAVRTTSGVGVFAGTTANTPYAIAVGTGTATPTISQTTLGSVVGSAGAYNLRTSLGIGSTFSQTTNGIAYGNGTYVAVGGAGYIVTSTDGLGWIQRISSTSVPLYAIVWVERLGLFVVGGNSGLLMTSPDGIAWTQRTSNNINPIVSFADDGTTLVATCNASSASVITSTNGISWVSRTLPSASWPNHVAYANGQFVAVGGSGSGAVRTSPDGVTWTARAHTANVSSKFTQVAYGNGTWVAVGFTGTLPIASSTDGVTWTGRSVGGSAAGLQSVAYGNDLFVACGSVGVIFTSPDGETWTQRTSQAGGQLLNQVLWSGTRFVVVGDAGTIVYSDDGVSWTRAATSHGATLGSPDYKSSAVYAGGRFLIGGVQYATSEGGVTWEAPFVWYSFAWTSNGSYALTEMGVFGSGLSPMFDRRTFSPINVVSGDQVYFSWQMSGVSGG